MQVPRALVAALALGTLLAAFLLGRQCAQGAPSTQEVPASTVVAEVPASPPARPPEPAPDLAAPALPAATPPETTSAMIPPEASPSPINARESEEIARYFQESEAIQARAKYWSDPQALAKTILDQTAGGNPGGFDELIQAQTKARTEMERLDVPAACAEHHRRSLAVMGEGLALLERVKNAFSSGDMSGLDGLQGKARDLEREARAIDELGQQIRERNGR